MDAVEIVENVLHENNLYFSSAERDSDKKIAQAIVAALADEQPHHIIFLSHDGWTIEHSMGCRLSGNLLDCEHTKILEGIGKRGEGFGGRLGRFIGVIEGSRMGLKPL